MLNYIFCDVSERMQLSFQDPATPIMEGLIDLHNNIMIVLVFIAFFVSTVLYRAIFLFDEKNTHKVVAVKHGAFIEIVWTVIPTLILVCMATPTFSLLYAMDEVIEPALTIKAVGHQWYWSYEYSDYENIKPISFDSYMVPESDLKSGEFRLLEVDNRLVVPTHSHIRVVVTSDDVIHSFAVPSLGIKVDAIPGRLNQATFYIKREGVFYGQCSEICGANHGFMPIVVHAVQQDQFLRWVLSMIFESEISDESFEQLVADV